ncbi:MAG: hypothetical protein IKU24_04480, partial [Clostridia bacterium]|nr:hypothetical protein [Clostridia bacterium]
MRNTKLWSVLLAAVLLCASVVGLVIVGAQAEGVVYDWYVDGVGAADDHYATIDDAMKAAYAKKDWAEGDSLAIYITKSGTATTFNTVQTGAQVNTGRHLFNVATIFRADNTKLPITIDGTEDMNSLIFGNTPAWTSGGKQAFIASNDYTFKNLDLTAWAATEHLFYAGSAMV